MSRQCYDQRVSCYAQSTTYSLVSSLYFLSTAAFNIQWTFCDSKRPLTVNLKYYKVTGMLFIKQPIQYRGYLVYFGHYYKGLRDFQIIRR